MFRTAIFALLLAESSAIKANSKAGRNVLKNAKPVDGKRQLNDNAMEANMAAIGAMTLKYTGCYNVFGLQEDGGGDDGSGILNQPVVTFKLASSTGSQEGEYAVSMLEFVDSYTESMMEEREWECENYRETGCYQCENADDADYCEQMCMQEAGMGDCIDDEDEEEQFEVQRYLECQGMEAANDNDNNYQYNQYNNNGNANYNQAYAAYPNWDGEYKIGPYCAADGKSVLLGVFYDDDCTIPASDGNSVYASMNYGQSPPYSSESVIPVDAVVPCVDLEAQAENNYNNNNNGNYNNNQWYNMEPKEFCTQAYETAAKCEKEGGSFYYPTSTGCDFIKSYLPVLSNGTPFHMKSGSAAAIVFAWLFAITTIMFGAYAYFLYRKIKRASGLSSQDGGAMA